MSPCRISSGAEFEFSDLQWIVDAYALTLAAFLLTAGSLADMFGGTGPGGRCTRTENPQPVAPAAAWHPGTTAMASPADEPEVAGQGDADRSMTSSVPDAEPEPVPEFPAASATASESTRWREVQVMFVDDPRSAVELAAGLVGDSSQALVAFVKEQQDSLLAAWHGTDAGTEELRVALQHYRAFGTRIADFSRKT